MLGLGAEFGKHKLRWTNLFIRDTLKQGRLAAGFNRSVQDQDPNLPPSIIEQNTYWFERQLIDTQFVGEFKFGDLSVDLRGTYANSQRESPYERDISYIYLGDGNPATKSLSDVDDYVNNLTSGGQSATIAFSDLNEDVYAGGIDLAYRLSGAMPTTLSARLRLYEEPSAIPRASSSSISGPTARSRSPSRRSGPISCSPTSTSTISTSSSATFRARRAPPPTTPASGSMPATPRPRSSCPARR